jgi:hypothetical protein
MAKLLMVLLSLVLFATIARAQVKEMPSQAELDPILENADTKLKDFLATLTEFKSEATALDEDRLSEDLKSIQQLRQMIQAAHSSARTKNAGLNMLRLVGILSGLDDMALDAATWKSLGELKMCQQLIQRQNASQYDQFSVRATMNSQMLHEVGGQLLHPTLRLSAAMDEIVIKILGATEQKSVDSHK